MLEQEQENERIQFRGSLFISTPMPLTGSVWIACGFRFMWRKTCLLIVPKVDGSMPMPTFENLWDDWFDFRYHQALPSVWRTEANRVHNQNEAERVERNPWATYIGSCCQGDPEANRNQYSDGRRTANLEWNRRSFFFPYREISATSGRFLQTGVVAWSLRTETGNYWKHSSVSETGYLKGGTDQCEFCSTWRISQTPIHFMGYGKRHRWFPFGEWIYERPSGHTIK